MIFIEGVFRYDQKKPITEGHPLLWRKYEKKDIGEPLADVYGIEIRIIECNIFVRFLEGLSYAPVCLYLSPSYVEGIKAIENNKRIKKKAERVEKYIYIYLYPFLLEFYESYRGEAGANAEALDIARALILAKLANIQTGLEVERVEIREA